MADMNQHIEAAGFDGNEESSLGWSATGSGIHSSGRYGQQTNIAADGSNPYGLPKDAMVRLQQRVLQHVASRKNELQSTIMKTIQNTVGSALSLGEEQYKSLLDQFAEQFGFGDCSGGECGGYTGQPGTISAGGGAQAGGSANVKVPSKEEQTANAKEGTKELVSLFQNEARVVVDMAVDTMVQLVKEGKCKFVSRPEAPPSMLARSFSSKSNPLTNPFSSQTAPLADPATTVCLPHPTFVAGHPKGLPGPAEPQSPVVSYSPVVTTFVSETSITEVTWLNFPSAPPVTPAGRSSGLPGSTSHSSHSSRHHSSVQMASSSVSRHTSLDQSVREAFDYFSFPGTGAHKDRSRSVAFPLREETHTPGRCRHTSHTPAACHITSFPPLPSRMQTNDWIVAPVKPTLKQENCSDLYNQGIDARCAPHASKGRGSNASRALMGITGSDAPRTKIYSTAPRTVRRCPDSSVDNRPGPKLGSSIGISSSRRRSPPYQVTPPSLMARIRRGSAQLGHAITSAVGITSHDQSTPTRRESSVTSLRRVLATIPQAASPSEANDQTCVQADAAEVANSQARGRAHAQTHHGHRPQRPGLTHQHSSIMVPHGDSEIPWRKDVAGRCGTCSEDSTAHVCLVASGDTSRTATPGLAAFGAFL